jgi:hypothetical protein
MGVTFWRKNLRGLNKGDFWSKNARGLRIGRGQPSPPMGGQREPLCPTWGHVQILDNPVIPRGLGGLSICMNDSYARAGLYRTGVNAGGQGGLGWVGKVCIATET